MALSGGIDSVALLDVMIREAATLGLRLSAVHVHHGISAHADHWARFCQRLCRRRRVALHIERVDILPWRAANGIESAARLARYGVFAGLDVDAVLLAHHMDDQAETVLLQLLRGAGVSGLAAMGVERTAWAGTLALGEASPTHVPKIVRPLLDVSRAEIAAYVARRRLAWVTDDTNDDTRFERNRLRRRLMPKLAQFHPAAVANLARSARHLATADRLLTELAQHDLAQWRSAGGLSVPAMLACGRERGQNALREWLRTASVPTPDTDQLDELWRQLSSQSGRRAMRFTWSGGWVIERYRDEIRLQTPGAVHRPTQPLALPWPGERTWRIDPLGGTLLLRPARGRGIAARHLRLGVVEVRTRRGGERIRLDPGAGHRTLKNLFQEHGVPPGVRALWPLLFIDGRLACVPGLGCADAFRAAAGQAGLEVAWSGDDRTLPGTRLAPLEESKKRAKIKS